MKIDKNFVQCWRVVKVLRVPICFENCKQNPNVVVTSACGRYLEFVGSFFSFFKEFCLFFSGADFFPYMALRELISAKMKLFEKEKPGKIKLIHTSL
jgi:hypothetical protein